MSSRSNYFASVEYAFKFADYSKLEETAKNNLGVILNVLSKNGFEILDILSLMVRSAHIGTAGKANLNFQEKKLIDAVFDNVLTLESSKLYAMIETPITEEDYTIMKNIDEMGVSVAMPLLEYIMCFAYVDGEFEDEVAERLDPIFGMTLLSHAMRGGFAE